MGSAPAHLLGTIIMKFLLLIAAIALSVLRPMPSQLSPTPPATTFPTPTGLHSPTPPPPPDARTKPVLWCLVPTVVSFPSESSPLQLLLPLLRPKLKPTLRLKLMPGISTAPTATGPMATVTLLTATLRTPTPVTTATMGLATTTATTAGRRGRRPLRLMLMLLLRPTPGCCMAPTVTDLHMEATTATATTTPPMPTLEAAVTILVVLSPVLLADRKERRCQQKIKIDSWNRVLISSFMFTQRVCQNNEIEKGNNRLTFDK